MRIRRERPARPERSCGHHAGHRTAGRRRRLLGRRRDRSPSRAGHGPGTSQRPRGLPSCAVATGPSTSSSSHVGEADATRRPFLRQRPLPARDARVRPGRRRGREGRHGGSDSFLIRSRSVTHLEPPPRGTLASPTGDAHHSCPIRGPFGRYRAPPPRGTLTFPTGAHRSCPLRGPSGSVARTPLDGRGARIDCDPCPRSAARSTRSSSSQKAHPPKKSFSSTTLPFLTL